MQSGTINKELVYGNKVVFGSVNAARRHYDQAADALAQADPGWLAQLITRRVTPEDWPLALKEGPRGHQDHHRFPERKPTMTSDPVACTTEQCQLGEGNPVGRPSQRAARVDILAGRVYRDEVAADGALVPVRSYRVSGTVGAVAPIDDDQGWLLAADRGFVFVAERRLRQLVTAAPDGTRMNDAACDPQGRFWAGTLAHDQHPGGGALYRLDRNGHTELMLDELTISNGLGWSPDGATMYLADEWPRCHLRVQLRSRTGHDLRPTCPDRRSLQCRITRWADGRRRE